MEQLLAVSHLEMYSWNNYTDITQDRDLEFHPVQLAANFDDKSLLCIKTLLQYQCFRKMCSGIKWMKYLSDDESIDIRACIFFAKTFFNDIKTEFQKCPWVCCRGDLETKPGRLMTLLLLFRLGARVHLSCLSKYWAYEQVAVIRSTLGYAVREEKQIHLAQRYNIITVVLSI